MQNKGPGSSSGAVTDTGIIQDRARAHVQKHLSDAARQTFQIWDSSTRAVGEICLNATFLAASLTYPSKRVNI